MSSFDFLYGNTGNSGTATSSTSTPDWYNDYTKGIAGKGVELAAAGEQNPIPQQEIAGFTPDQIAAFQGIRDQQGAWKPGMNAATSSVQGGIAAAEGAAGAANAAVAGPSKSFTDAGTVASYMSPYTDSVVQAIADKGTKNFNEKIMPGLQAGAIGAGQFGSTRNADLLGRAAADVQSDITQQQSQALQAGYNTAGTLFNADADRAQQQQNMQASTALQGGSLASGAGITGGQQLGGLATAEQQLRFGDNQALQAAGQQQQQLNQTGLDTAYNNQVAKNNAGWDNLDKLNSIVRGVQLPTSTTSTVSGGLSRTQGTSPISALGSLYSTAIQ